MTNSKLDIITGIFTVEFGFGKNKKVYRLQLDKNFSVIFSIIESPSEITIDEANERFSGTIKQVNYI